MEGAAVSEPGASAALERPLLAVSHPSEALARTLAPWIADTDPEFYGLLGFPRSDLETRIAALIREPKGDLAPLWIGGTERDPVGVICAYGVGQMRARQMLGLRQLLAGHTAVAALGSRIKAFSAERAAVDPQAFYLAKIYVAPAQRGQGWGDALLCYFIDEGRRQGKPLCALHVRRDNSSAVGLYLRHGFIAPDLQADGRYLHLERRLRQD
jgi:ribosomal protein S18 acetylase RimI-like enzyme